MNILYACLRAFDLASIMYLLPEYIRCFFSILLSLHIHFATGPVGIYLLNVNYRNTRKKCETCSKLKLLLLLILNIIHTLF